MKRFKKSKIKGTSTRPRICVFRSNNHIYAQVIDDFNSTTIAACSTVETNVKERLNNTSTCEAALIVGKSLAIKLKEKNILKLKFDRGKKIYHGRIAAIAKGLREEGLEL